MPTCRQKNFSIASGSWTSSIPRERAAALTSLICQGVFKKSRRWSSMRRVASWRSFPATSLTAFCPLLKDRYAARHAVKKNQRDKRGDQYDLERRFLRNGIRRTHWLGTPLVVVDLVMKLERKCLDDIPQFERTAVHLGFADSREGNQSFQLWSHIVNMPRLGSQGMPDQDGLVTIDTPYSHKSAMSRNRLAQNTESEIRILCLSARESKTCIERVCLHRSFIAGKIKNKYLKRPKKKCMRKDACNNRIKLGHVVIGPITQTTRDFHIRYMPMKSKDAKTRTRRSNHSPWALAWCFACVLLLPAVVQPTVEAGGLPWQKAGLRRRLQLSAIRIPRRKRQARRVQRRFDEVPGRGRRVRHRNTPGSLGAGSTRPGTRTHRRNPGHVLFRRKRRRIRLFHGPYHRQPLGLRAKRGTGSRRPTRFRRQGNRSHAGRHHARLASGKRDRRQDSSRRNAGGGAGAPGFGEHTIWRSQPSSPDSIGSSGSGWKI